MKGSDEMRRSEGVDRDKGSKVERNEEEEEEEEEEEDGGRMERTSMDQTDAHVHGDGYT